MHPHNFSFELEYSNGTHSCCVTYGSERFQSSIQIEADPWKLRQMANDLAREQCPDDLLRYENVTGMRDLRLMVLPHESGNKQLCFYFSSGYQLDGNPYRADIRFELNPKEAADFASRLKAWCAKPDYPFVWKGD